MTVGMLSQDIHNNESSHLSYDFQQPLAKTDHNRLSS